MKSYLQIGTQEYELSKTTEHEYRKAKRNGEQQTDGAIVPKDSLVKLFVNGLNIEYYFCKPINPGVIDNMPLHPDTIPQILAPFKDMGISPNTDPPITLTGEPDYPYRTIDTSDAELLRPVYDTIIEIPEPIEESNDLIEFLSK